jgi:putative redox protein
VRVVARRTGVFAHEIDIDGQHALIVDEPPEIGGQDLGPRPTQLLAASLAGCTAITMELYAERKGWDIGTVEVAVETAYEKATPSAFEVMLRLPAELSDEQRQRLVAIAAKCPVHKVLAGEVPVRVAETMEPL